MSIVFGVPTRNVNRKEEKYPDNPVLTLLPLEGKGFGRKFNFNKKALEELNITPGMSYVVFAFDDAQRAYLGISDAPEDNNSVAVAKNMSFSNKKYYDYISKLFNLDNDIENDFELIHAGNVNGVDLFELNQISNEVPTTSQDQTPIMEGNAQPSEPESY